MEVPGHPEVEGVLGLLVLLVIHLTLDILVVAAEVELPVMVEVLVRLIPGVVEEGVLLVLTVITRLKHLEVDAVVLVLLY
jgi:hypothetical protein